MKRLHLHPRPRLRRRPAVVPSSGAPRRRGVALAVTTCLLSACGFSHGTTLDIGLNRVGVNLQFANGNLNPPPIFEKIVIPAGVGPASLISTIDYNQQGSYLPPPRNTVHFASVAPFVCHAAPAGAKPIDSSPVAVSSPPSAGTYLTHQTGKFSLSDGKINLAGSVPPTSSMSIGKVVSTPQSGGLSAVTGTQDITWQVVSQGVGTVTTTDYEATSSELELVSETVSASGTTYSFTPSPAVEIMAFSGTGATWNSAGVDKSSGTVMTVQGKILGQAPVDVCGTVYDTYQVQSTEDITNVTAGISSQTSATDPNVYWVATQFGGLFLSEHIDETETLATSAEAAVLTGGVARLSVDYTSTVDSVTPVKSS